MMAKLAAGCFGGLAFALGTGALTALVLPGARTDRALAGAFAILLFWVPGLIAGVLAPTPRAAWLRVLVAAGAAWLGVVVAR